MADTARDRETLGPGLAEAWEREAHRLVVRIFKGRALFVPVMTLLVFLAYLVWEPVGWKLAWVGTVSVVVLGFSVFEYRRAQRVSPGELALTWNLLVPILLQTAIIYITGGIESPLLVVYVPIALAAGVSLTAPRRLLGVVALPVSLCLAFALGGIYGWFPRATPTFFSLGEGFAHKPVYALATALVIVFLVISMATIGSIVRQAHEQIARKVSDARQEALETMVSRNRELVSITRTIAHELKNPLSSIQGLAQLMLRNAAGAKDQERLEVMLREIVRMRDVLEDFRTFARPLSDLHVASLRLSDLVHETVSLHEGMAARRHVAMRAVGTEELVVICDARKVQQVLVNLIQNAIEASPRGGEVVIRSARANDNRVRVTVSDEGSGLSEHAIDSVFTPGFTTKRDGSGLGLAVAASIAQQHGGCLTLTNRPKGGCDAVLELPNVSRSTEEPVP